MTPPPSGQASSAWTRRSPALWTAVSRKPTTSTRKRTSAWPSRAVKAGQTLGAGTVPRLPVVVVVLCVVSMTSPCPVGVGPVLDVSALLGEPARGGGAGVPAEVVDQVGRVRGPGPIRDPGGPPTS